MNAIGQQLGCLGLELSPQIKDWPAEAALCGHLHLGQSASSGSFCRLTRLPQGGHQSFQLPPMQAPSSPHISYPTGPWGSRPGPTRAAPAPEQLQGDRENGKIPSPVLAKPCLSPPAGSVLNWGREKQKEKGARGKRQSQPGETQQKFPGLLLPLASPVPTPRAPRASATCAAVCRLGIGPRLCR